MPSATDRRTWVTVPGVPARLALTATSGPDAPAALSVYRVLARGPAVAARVAGVAARFGLARRATEPPGDLLGLCRHLGIDAGGVAVMRSSHGERFVAGVAAARRLHTVVKLGPPGDEGLAREAAALDALAAQQRVRGPRLRWCGAWGGRQGLAVDAVVPATRRTIAPADVVPLCVALWEGVPGLGPVVHGDLTPWNVLPAEDGPVVIDWEDRRLERDPLFDLAHFVTQESALLGRRSPADAVALLVEPGSPGWRYLEAVGVPPGDAPLLVREYARRTNWFGHERAQRFRAGMRQALDARQARA